MKRTALFLAVLVTMLILPAGTVFAQGPVDGSGGQVFTQQDVSLGPGETFEGDLSVIDGNLDMAEGSTVLGDVFLTSGRATIAGQVKGNTAIVGGQMALAATGQVMGDVFALGGKHDLAGQVNGNVSILFGETILRSSGVILGDLLAAPGNLAREEGSKVTGDVVTGLALSPRPSGEDGPVPERLPEVTPAPPASPQVPEVIPPAQAHAPASQSDDLGDRLARFAGRVVSAMLLSFLVIAIGVLIALVWPRPTQRVAECIAALPGQSFGLGLLTFLLAAGLEVVAVFLMVLVILAGALLMATIVLIPVGLLLIFLSGLVLLPVPIALAGGVLLGWVGLAEIVGRKLLDAFHARDASLLGHVLVGLLITIVPAVILWVIHPWCCGLPFILVLTSVGLGAVFHTRFGKQGCQKQERVLEPAPSPTGAADKGGAQSVAPAGASLPAGAMDEEQGLPDSGGAQPVAPAGDLLPAGAMDEEQGLPDILPPPPPPANP